VGVPPIRHASTRLGPLSLTASYSSLESSAKYNSLVVGVIVVLGRDELVDEVFNPVVDLVTDGSDGT
jgi:hypothetical protein